MGNVVKNIQLTYSLGQTDEGQFQLLAGAYSADNNPSHYNDQGAIDSFFLPIVTENLNSVLDRMKDDYGWKNFDYRSEILDRNIAYVILVIEENPIPEKTEIAVYSKFRNDPLFSLVFINKEVAIFKVHGNLK
jgi:hypothetical protein